MRLPLYIIIMGILFPIKVSSQQKHIEKLLSVCDYHNTYWKSSANRPPDALVEIWLKSVPKKYASIYNIGLAIHESYHYETAMLNAISPTHNTRKIYGDSSIIEIHVSNMSSCRSLSDTFTFTNIKRSQLSRFNTYVFSEDTNHITQQFGVAGLLEECIAYKNQFNSELCVFEIFKDSVCENSQSAINYLVGVSSTRIACKELLLYTLCYLDYLRDRDTTSYKMLITNKAFCQNLTATESAIRNADSLYLRTRQLIQCEYKNIEIKEGILSNKNAPSIQYDLFDRLYNDLLKELTLPQYKPICADLARR